MTSKATTSTRRGIQSVGIGMRVLTAVASMPDAAPLSAIAQKANLSASQAHRYLSSLMAAGMLKQEERSGLYDLDAGAIRLGLAALARVDAFSNATEFVVALVRKTRRTAFIAIWGDAGPTVIRWFPGVPPVVTATSVGSSLPLLRTATGHIFATFGDRGEMDRQVDLLRISDPAGVPSNLEAMRSGIEATLVARISGDFIPGLRAMAAPVFDLQGRLALSVSMLANSAFPESGDQAAEDALLETCGALTRSLGGHWPRADDDPTRG